MKVQLVTHSKFQIQNLNFGLVPIDPVGLVILTNIFVLTVRYTAFPSIKSRVGSWSVVMFSKHQHRVAS